MANIFNPSSFWQEVPENTALPPDGLDVRMNLATGKNYARIHQPKPEAPTLDTSRLEAALYYAEQLYWPVFPVWWIDDTGKCACGKPECHSPGKHPITRNGLHDATIDPEIISKWFTQYPKANIGGATGEISNRFVIDIDPRHGGDESLLNLETTHGKMPFTQTQLTGGGGSHLIFAYPGPIGKSKVENIAPGIDTRGDGGYIVLAPSNHISGKQYEWEVSSSPHLVGLTEVPEWLKEILRSPNKPNPGDSQPDDSKEIPQGSRNSELTRRAGILRAIGLSEEGVYAALCVDNTERCNPPLSEKEVRAIAHSVSRYSPNKNKQAENQEPEELFIQAQQAPTKGRLNAVEKLAAAVVQKKESVSTWAQRVKDAGLCSIGTFKAIVKDIEDHSNRKLDDSDIADRWEEYARHTAYGLGEWRRYDAGTWPKLSEIEIEGEIESVLKHSRQEGVRYTHQTVRSVLNIAKSRIHVADNLWDSDPDLLPCQNGVLHIPTMTLREHSPENHFTFKVGYDFAPESYPEAWNYLVNSIFDDDQVKDFLQEYAGYCLTTDTRYEVALWLQGPRGSGKSTFITGLQTMLGDRAATLSLSSIEQSRFALAGIVGKTLLTATEQPITYIQQSHILNALISGEPITVEQKYQVSRDYRPCAKIVWAMNELPRVPDSGNGLFRRVKVIEFPKLDPSQIDERMKETISKEGSGILNWALVGLQRLRERGKFLIPEKVQKAVKDFEQSNNVPALFIDEICESGPAFEVKASVLYNFYTTWCVDNGHKPESSTRLAQSWKDLGFKKEARRDGNYWIGVKIR